LQTTVESDCHLVAGCRLRKVVMRRMIRETLELSILLQIGVAATTREKIEEVVNRLIERGRIERAEGRALLEKILSRVRERSVGARSLVDVSVQALRGASTTTSETYEDLFFRVEQLEHRVRLLEGRYTASSPEEPFEVVVPSVSGEPRLR
jgi:polyhydroxyalkanoate synthesis regulator phasin